MECDKGFNQHLRSIWQGQGTLVDSLSPIPWACLPPGGAYGFVVGLGTWGVAEGHPGDDEVQVAAVMLLLGRDRAPRPGHPSCVGHCHLLYIW